jgi:hypothetical protein
MATKNMDGWLKLSFDSPKLDVLREKLKKKSLRIHEVLFVKVEAVMQQLASFVITEKLSGQVLKKQTGLLQSSIRVVPTTSQGGVIHGGVEVGRGPRRSVAMIHTMGMDKAYEIIGTKNKMLHFWVGQKEMFRKRVEHPAISPKPFMHPSLDENREQIIQELAQSVAQVLKEK